MANYRPNYETTVRTSTVTQRHNTLHTNSIDWENYPFDDREHFWRMCYDQPTRNKCIEEKKAFLRLCEQYKAKEVFASNDGGWPRIWHRVVGVGMASAWPYWQPRPTVLIEGSLGTEWVDWTSLTGAKGNDSDG